MKNETVKTLRGSLLLLLGAVIWGSAFAAQRAGMDHVGPFTFSAVRMLLAGIVMVPIASLSERRAGAPARTAVRRSAQRKGGLLCGLLLFTATSLQQAGLRYTAAGKAGFITALYVVLVPVAAMVFFLVHPGRVIWLGVALAVVALWLLCVPPEGFAVERGDLLLLGCAVCFTGQILCVDRFAPRVNAAALARDQFLVTGILSVIPALCLETVTLSGLREALFPILYTGLFSGALGYSLQIIGQRDLNPTLASLIMCLESVFAVLTGALLLGERLTPRESAGCALMFAAVLLAQLSPLLSRRRKAPSAS